MQGKASSSNLQRLFEVQQPLIADFVETCCQLQGKEQTQSVIHNLGQVSCRADSWFDVLVGACKCIKMAAGLAGSLKGKPFSASALIGCQSVAPQ